MGLRLSLLRHGKTESNGDFCSSFDGALTARGWARMCTAVGGGHWDPLIGSLLQRCHTFAEEPARRQGIELELENSLRELHFGAQKGRLAAVLMDGHSEAFGRFWADPYAFTPPGGKPLSEFEARVPAAQRYLRQRYADRRMLLVTHGDVMRLLLTRVRGLPHKRLLQVDIDHGALFGLRAEEGDDRWHECRGGE